MDATWRALDPWLRELRGVVQAVPVTREAYEDDCEIRTLAKGSKLQDLRQLRVVLPRPSNFSFQNWRQPQPQAQQQQQQQQRRNSDAVPNQAKLLAIREGLDLLWLVRHYDEKAWKSLLVNCCGVGGEEAASWIDDVRLLPVLHFQPNAAETIDAVLSSIQQCQYLLVTLQDDGLHSQEFRQVKNQLMDMMGLDSRHAFTCSGYYVTLGNWLSPRLQLTASESDTMWEKASTMLLEARDPFQSKRPSESGHVPPWQLQAIDLHLHRTVLTFDAALSLLDLVACGVGLNELWMDLSDRTEDQLTATGAASVLKKLFASGSRPRFLHVDCENASISRLQALSSLLQTPSASAACVSLQRFGMSADRTPAFEALGESLAPDRLHSLKLDIPTLTIEDVACISKIMEKGYQSVGLSSLILTVDSHRETWPAVFKLLHLIGWSLQSLELAINGASLSEDATAAILEVCPRLERLKLDRVTLKSTNPFVDCLQSPSSELRLLQLPRFHAPYPLLDKFPNVLSSGQSNQLEELHLDLSELVSVHEDLIADFTAALRLNPYIHTLSLTLDTDAAAALPDPVHDDFYHLHNLALYQPLRSRCKLAFLSVIAAEPTSSRHLSQLPIHLVFQFAAARDRRHLNIREPATAW